MNTINNKDSQVTEERLKTALLQLLKEKEVDDCSFGSTSPKCKFSFILSWRSEKGRKRKKLAIVSSPTQSSRSETNAGFGHSAGVHGQH